MVMIDAIVPGTPTQSEMMAILSLVDSPCDPPPSEVVVRVVGVDAGVDVGVVSGGASAETHKGKEPSLLQLSSRSQHHPRGQTPVSPFTHAELTV